MIRKLMSNIWKVEGMDYKDNPGDAHATFNVVYEKQVIAVLSYNGNVWQFAYTDEFIQNPVTKPITDFPDVNRTYTSEKLWPFFASRIPVINQPFHLKKIRKANIREDDSIGLLKLFGKVTISNPFKLHAV
ncbi:MAG: HipA N-terminal domain-containing protein [Bacteroidales bacterium]|nr:HipA N-terminal domain-containing protein [Bacteroidales bacterium]